VVAAAVAVRLPRGALLHLPRLLLMYLDARLLFTRLLFMGLLSARVLRSCLLLPDLMLTLLLLSLHLPLAVFQLPMILLMALIGVDSAPSGGAVAVRRAVDMGAPVIVMSAVAPAAPIGPIVGVGIGPPPRPVMEKRT
jgi:hypothetical protein